MNINEGNIDCNIYISSTTRISPLEDQNFSPGGKFPPGWEPLFYMVTCKNMQCTHIQRNLIKLQHV